MVSKTFQTDEPLIVESTGKETLFVRHVSTDHILFELDKMFGGKCRNGSYIIKGSIKLISVSPAVTHIIVNPGFPYRILVNFSYREFIPITGKVYKAVVNKIDAKGTILRFIPPGETESSMVITVVDKYFGSEGDVVPIVLTHKFVKNGRSEISAIGEFVDSD